MKKISILILVALALLQWTTLAQGAQEISLENAYQDHKSHVQVKGRGTVIRILKDDNKGSRHQKFIVKLPSSQTVLISHNIDLAPRIDSISKGDTVQFYGEYEWNDKGGVVHWTHKDPNKNHVNGWLKHQGIIYQ